MKQFAWKIFMSHHQPGSGTIEETRTNGFHQETDLYEILGPDY